MKILDELGGAHFDFHILHGQRSSFVEAGMLGKDMGAAVPADGGSAGRLRSIDLGNTLEEGGNSCIHGRIVPIQVAVLQ